MRYLYRKFPYSKETRPYNLVSVTRCAAVKVREIASRLVTASRRGNERDT